MRSNARPEGNLGKAQLLLDRARYLDAERELRQAIARRADDAFAHALLAIALAMQKKYEEAIREAESAVALAPDVPYCHFALAMVLHDTESYNKARTAVEEAIRMDPADPRYYGLLGSIHLHKGEWQEALDVAERGLYFDSENVRLNNIRAFALVKLGRREEAGLTIEAALAREPENPTTHANQGWALLHLGQHKQAMFHFSEALRLDPTSGWAKAGIVEALKARNPIYWIMLRYFLWMSRLNPRTRWGIVIGMYLLSQVVRSVAVTSPGLAPVLNPLLILYSAFALLTWISRPLFNLFLRLDRFGRLALSAEQIVASNWVGICLLAAALLLVGGISFANGALVSAAIVPLAMVVPVSGIFQRRPGRARVMLIGYAALLGLAGLGGSMLSPAVPSLAESLTSIFWLGWMAYPWIANFILAR